MPCCSSVPYCYSLRIDSELPLLKLFHPLHLGGRAEVLERLKLLHPCSSSSTACSSWSTSSIPCSSSSTVSSS
jgi:hypothetical protein